MTTTPQNKSQLVRLLDVFVFGPLMIAAAGDQKNAYFRTALTLIGIGTIVYNGVNYLQTAKREAAGATVETVMAGIEGRAPYRRPIHR